MGAVDLDLGMNAVVLKQNDGGCIGRTLPASEFCGIFQRRNQHAVLDRIACHISMRAGGEGGNFVERRFGSGNHLLAACLVIAFGRRFSDDSIGAIERIIERTPTRIGSVQRIACIGHGHDELRASHGGNFRIDILRLDCEGGRRCAQIADLLQHGLVGDRIMRLTFAGLVPSIDLELELITHCEQRFILWREVAHQGAETLEESLFAHARAGQGFFDDEIMQSCIDRETGNLDA